MRTTHPANSFSAAGLASSLTGFYRGDTLSTFMTRESENYQVTQRLLFWCLSAHCFGLQPVTLRHCCLGLLSALLCHSICSSAEEGLLKNWMLPAPATKELASSPNWSLINSYKSYSSNWKDKRTRPPLSKCNFSHQTQHFGCTSAFILHDNGVLEPPKLQTTGSRVKPFANATVCAWERSDITAHFGHVHLHLRSNSHMQVHGPQKTMVD